MNQTNQAAGYSNDEINELIKLSSFALPDDYVKFMRTHGKSAATSIFLGSLCSPKDIHDIIEDANYLITEAGLSLDTLKDKFVFIMHQGYQFYCLDERSVIYYYHERYPRLIRVSNSFSEWISKDFFKPAPLPDSPDCPCTGSNPVIPCAGPAIDGAENRPEIGPSE